MKTFVIRDQYIADRACAYIRSLVGSEIVWAVTVAEFHGKRTRDQNDRLHKALRTIAEEGWLNGRQGRVEDWKAYLMVQGGFCDTYTDLSTGELKATPMSTSKMTVKQMSDLIEFVVRYAAQNLGVEA